jgi:predicted Rossmann fold nucleotide-binding protein DprA/Smf involved in DNA uptake
VVLKDLNPEWEIILSALYLPGSPHGLSLSRRAWPALIGAVRAHALGTVDCGPRLALLGFPSEGAALSTPGTLDWAAQQVDEGRSLTLLSPAFPSRWLAVLGDQAPPAIWCRASGDPSPMPRVSIVGSRDVEPEVHRFCADCARAAIGAGFQVVSGGAMGCDRAAVSAAVGAGGPSAVLAPFGSVQFPKDLPARQAWLSICPPEETFSRARAMERNALIYAAGEATVIGQSKFRQGGTWHGAVAALRRGSCRLLIRRPSESDSEDAKLAARALVALGASYLDSPADLAGRLEVSPSDRQFSLLRVG